VKVRLIALLLTLSMISMIAPAQASTPPSKPAETPPVKLYTEAEALAAVDAALEEAIPRAVQAAVAQKEGELAGERATLAAVRSDLIEAAKDARRARAWTVGVAIGSAVLIPAAFIGGALAWGALPR
jgi:hypothetical protein